MQKPSNIVYFGQPVALVIAETFEAARHGAQVLRLKVKAASDVIASPDDPDVEIETPRKKQPLTGDLDKAMRDGAFTVDETYTTPGHVSGAMEPHASVASLMRTFRSGPRIF